MRGVTVAVLAALVASCSSSPSAPSVDEVEQEPGTSRATAVGIGESVEVDALRTVDTPVGSYVSNSGRVRITATSVVRGDEAVEAVNSWHPDNHVLVSNMQSALTDYDLALVTLRIDAVRAPNEFDSIHLNRSQFSIVRQDGQLYLSGTQSTFGSGDDSTYGALIFREGSVALHIAHWLHRTDRQPYLQYNRREENSRWFRLY